MTRTLGLKMIKNASYFVFVIFVTTGILHGCIYNAISCEAWVTPNIIALDRLRLGGTSTSLSSSKVPYFAMPIIGSKDDLKSSSSNADRDGPVQELLNLGRKLGPVGVFQSKEDQDLILNSALQLERYSDANPAMIPLTGVHDLVYSAAPGGSSGKIGPFSGKVIQDFVDDKTFINAVEIGPVKIALTVERKIRDAATIEVFFKRTTISLFNQKIIENETRGGGIWKYIFAGTIRDNDGTTKFIRIMQTPSLFIIEQPISTN